MLHTFIISSVPRSEKRYGLYIEAKACFVDKKVMRVLEKVEYIYPGVGRALVPIYFPGLLRADEEIFWQRARESEEARNATIVYL
jgi:hypothetical protein